MRKVYCRGFDELVYVFKYIHTRNIREIRETFDLQCFLKMVSDWLASVLKPIRKQFDLDN